MKSTESTVVIKWKPQRGEKWFLRGVSRNGRAYGEFQSLTAQRDLEFCLSSEDCRRLWVQLDRVIAADPRLGNDGWDGLLAVGKPSSPKVVYHYHRDRPDRSGLDAAFEELVRILEPYVHGTEPDASPTQG